MDTRNWLNRRPARNRYVVVYDSVDENNKVYGIMKLDTVGIRTNISLQFFNDDGNIDLNVREIPKIEWETMEAFELFPILTPYYRDPIPRPISGVVGKPTKRDKDMTTIFKVRFRDY